MTSKNAAEDRDETPLQPIVDASIAVVETVARTFDLRRWWVFFRSRAKQGYGRVVGSFVPIVQSAVAGALAYLFSEKVLGHHEPVFAAVSCWLCLGFSRNRIPRKVAEMGAGATIGVLIGEVFGAFLGIGAWQLVILITLAPLLARFIDRGDLFTAQTVINAVTVASLSASNSSGSYVRWLDALIGSVTAFVFSVVLPRNVTSRARRYARLTLDELAGALLTLAKGLRQGSDEVLFDSEAKVRSLEITLTDGRLALDTAAEVTNLNPTLRKDRDIVAELKRTFSLLERSLTSTRMLIRQARGVVSETGAEPDVADIVESVAAALNAMAASIPAWTDPVHARQQALIAAEKCSPEEVTGDDWRGTVLVSLLRALAVDALQMTGLSWGEARQALPDIGGLQPETEADEDEEDEEPAYDTPSQWHEAAAASLKADKG